MYREDRPPALHKLHYCPPFEALRDKMLEKQLILVSLQDQKYILGDANAQLARIILSATISVKFHGVHSYLASQTLAGTLVLFQLICDTYLLCPRD
jgi:hypothetical protein